MAEATTGEAEATTGAEADATIGAEAEATTGDAEATTGEAEATTGAAIMGAAIIRRGRTVQRPFRQKIWASAVAVKHKQPRIRNIRTILVSFTKRGY
jgi:hypothetical protein